MKAKRTVAGSLTGNRTVATVAKALRRPGSGHFVPSKAFRDFDARLEQAHRRADDVLAKLAKR